MSNEVSVEAWFPLKAYTLQIRYKLLSELGELSHFILEVMSRYGIRLDEIENITDLRRDQIRPVIERLKGLKFIDKDDHLTPLGEKIAYVLCFIHDKSFQICLDQHYHYSYNNEPIIFARTDSLSVDEIPENAIQVKKPSGMRYSSSEDSYSQVQRLQGRLPDFLVKLIPNEIEPLLAKDEKWSNEWEVTLKSCGESKNTGFKINVNLKNYDDYLASRKKEKDIALAVYTGLTILTTEFNLAEGIKCDEWPQVYSLEPSVISEIGDKVYHHDVSCSEAPDDLVIESFSLGEIEKKLQYLILMDDTVSRIDDSMKLYSRRYTFKNAWQAHEYTYAEILTYCNDGNIFKV